MTFDLENFKAAYDRWVAETNYSFGYVNDAATLVKKTIPEFIARLKAQAVDVLFLVPV